MFLLHHTVSTPAAPSPGHSQHSRDGLRRRATVRCTPVQQPVHDCNLLPCGGGACLRQPVPTSAPTATARRALLCAPGTVHQPLLSLR